MRSEEHPDAGFTVMYAEQGRPRLTWLQRARELLTTIFVAVPLLCLLILLMKEINGEDDDEDDAGKCAPEDDTALGYFEELASLDSEPPS